MDVDQYHRVFPELVQKLYTVKTERRVLEDHNYEKFFHAVRTADTDKWDLEGQVVNSSFKPFARSLLTGVENTVNSSPEAGKMQSGPMQYASLQSPGIWRTR